MCRSSVYCCCKERSNKVGFYYADCSIFYAIIGYLFSSIYRTLCVHVDCLWIGNDRCRAGLRKEKTFELRAKGVSTLEQKKIHPLG